MNIWTSSGEKVNCVHLRDVALTSLLYCFSLDYRQTRNFNPCITAPMQPLRLLIQLDISTAVFVVAYSVQLCSLELIAVPLSENAVSYSNHTIRLTFKTCFY